MNRLNLERIKELSTEELAEFLSYEFSQGVCEKGGNISCDCVVWRFRPNTEEFTCKDCWINWLNERKDVPDYVFKG